MTFRALWGATRRTTFALLLVALPAPLVTAATGPADSFGYTWADDASGCATTVAAFGAGATTRAAATTTQGPFNLGFTMPFYGQAVNQAWVSPNGYLTFSNQGAGVPAQCPTAAAPNHLIAAFWSTSLRADITVEATPAYFHVRWFQRVDLDDYDTHLFLYPNGNFRINWVTTGLIVASVVLGYEDSTGTQGRTFLRQVNYAPQSVDGSFPTSYPGRSVCVTAPVLLDCSMPTLATCGSAIASTLPASDPSPASFYRCSPTILLGNERVFRVDLATPQQVTVEITNPALQLMRVPAAPGCAETQCLGAYGQRADLPFIAPGSSWWVVDKAAAGGGDAFEFRVTCSDPYTYLSCPSSVAGDTTGRSSAIDMHACSPNLTGPEALHVVSLAAQGSFTAILQGANPNQWVVIYDRATFESGSIACLGAGRGGAGAFNVPAGDYVVLVDGEAGAAGPFTLVVACGRQLDCSSARTVSCTERLTGNTSGSANRAAIYSCLPELLAGGEDVYRFFNPIDQTITAGFVTQQPGHRMLLLPACDEGRCYLAGSQGVSCALFPAGEYFLIVDSAAGQGGAYEAEILCSEFVPGFDLRVTSIDASALTGACGSLLVNGTARVAVTNLGTTTVPAPFDVVVFEDGATSVDGLYDRILDNTLGQTTVLSPLSAGDTAFVDVAGAGAVLFRDNVLYAMVDPGGLVAEVDETNNLYDTGRGCEFRPPVGDFSPIIEWSWNASTVEPTMTDVDTVPLVGDVDGDGMPDIVINTAPAGSGNRTPAIVRVLRGDGSGEVWSSTAPETRVWGRSQLAMADLDMDGRLEIIGQSAVDTSTLVALDDDGSLLWTSAPLVGITLTPVNFGGGGASIADIDCDGTPEIIFAHNILRADGTFFWQPAAGGTVGNNIGTFGSDCPLSVVADVNGDGRLDVIAGPTVYTWNPGTGRGDILWTNPLVPDGHAAVGNFDADDLPEIALAASGTVYLLEGDTGAIIWQRQIPRGGGGCTIGAAADISGGPPTVADFDGDCAAEVGVAGADFYTVFETDGSVKWSSPINDCSSHRTASSVFDFEGDGAAEVAFMDQVRLHVFRGTDGVELSDVPGSAPPVPAIPSSSHTWIEMISIADCDADNNAEIIMPLNRGGATVLFTGIQVVGDADDNWVNTRRIWNQHQYHISHILEDGRVPSAIAGGCERPSWRIHNTYRDQIGSAVFSAPDITISILETETILRPDCFRDLRIVARVGNGGAQSVGRGFIASFYDGDPAAGGTLLYSAPIPDLAPGAYGDFEVIIPFPRFGQIEIHALADDDGTGVGAGAVNECREDNNVCIVTVDNAQGGTVGTLPRAVGAGLRVGNHGDPHAADITAVLDWTRDEGLPRPADNHYHVMRSIDPRALGLLPGTDPWTPTTYLDTTPATLSTPFVHFYKVRAADVCEQLESSQ